MPEISILMPVYNAEEYLKDSLESVLNQSFGDFELLILDDNSVDKSIDILRSYQKIDRRIHIHISEINNGIVYQLNKGLEIATGKYIARMDADDIIHPDRLKIQYDFLEANQEYEICSSFFQKFGSSHELIRLPENDLDIKAGLIVNSTLCHASVMGRSKILKKNKYEEGFTAAEDYRLWCRLAKESKFYNIPKVLYYYRFHDFNTSLSASLIERKSEAIKKIRKDYLISIVENFDEEGFELYNGILSLNQKIILDKKTIDTFFNFIHRIANSSFLSKQAVIQIAYKKFTEFILSTKNYELFIGYKLLFQYPRIFCFTTLLDVMRIIMRSSNKKYVLNEKK